MGGVFPPTNTCHPHSKLTTLPSYKQEPETKLTLVDSFVNRMAGAYLSPPPSLLEATTEKSHLISRSAVNDKVIIPRFKPIPQKYSQTSV